MGDGYRSRPSWVRRAGGNPDANNQAIADFARRLGVTVTITTQIGKGFVDQVWGFGRDPGRNIPGVTLLVEVKRRGKSLNPDQAKFRDDWQGGPVVMVASTDDVTRVLTGPLVRQLLRAQAVRCGFLGTDPDPGADLDHPTAAGIGP